MSDEKSTTTPATTSSSSPATAATAPTTPATVIATSPSTPTPTDAPAPKSRAPKATKPAEPAAQPTNEELRQTLLEEKRTKRDADQKADREKFTATLKEYDYKGPLSSVSFANGYEVHLHPGKRVMLPPDEQATKNLLERKYLELASDAKKGVN